MSNNILPKKDQPNPHICLKCGKELVRGRESYKIRHWQQNHKNENPKNALANIVPKDHESARKLLATMKKKEAKPTDPLRKHEKTYDILDQGGKSSDCCDESLSTSVESNKPTTPFNVLVHNKDSVDEVSQKSKKKTTKEMTVQRTLNDFVVNEGR